MHAADPAGTEPEEVAAKVPARQMIPVADLAAHPGNVRDTLNLTDEFKASVAAEGVRIPLLVTTTQDGGWRVLGSGNFGMVTIWALKMAQNASASVPIRNRNGCFEGIAE